MVADNGPNSVDRSRGSGDLWRQVLDSLTAELAVLDKRGTIIAVNDAWRRFAAENGGSPQKTGVGVNYLDVCRSAAGGDSLLAEQACCGIEQVFRRAREVFTLEYSCHSPAKQRWFLLSVSRLQAEDDFVVTTHLSITERKLTEQKLVMSERLAAIGEAMRGLTHEGRNALQRAQACIELLQVHVAEDSKALELLERIGNAQEHLLDLYEQVGSYAAPITLRPRTCRLSDLVDEVGATFASRAKLASFSNLALGDNSNCDIDVSAIRQVLQIVFENSLATRSGSPEIEVSYIEDELDGSAAITVIVSDNGPGVSPEDREKVFEPFHTTKTRGTGLGLAIAKRIVTEHGGCISFGTPRRGGASVYITLPRRTSRTSSCP